MLDAFVTTIIFVALAFLVYFAFRGFAWLISEVLPKRDTVSEMDYRVLQAELVAEKETTRQLRVRLDMEVQRGVNQAATLERLRQREAGEGPGSPPTSPWQDAVDEAVQEVLAKQEYPEHDIGGEG